MEYDLCIRLNHEHSESGDTFSRDEVVGKVIIHDDSLNLSVGWGYGYILKLKETEHPTTPPKLMLELDSKSDEENLIANPESVVFKTTFTPIQTFTRNSLEEDRYRSLLEEYRSSIISDRKFLARKAKLDEGYR